MQRTLAAVLLAAALLGGAAATASADPGDRPTPPFNATASVSNHSETDDSANQGVDDNGVDGVDVVAPGVPGANTPTHAAWPQPAR